jgi:hypothetical protein
MFKSTLNRGFQLTFENGLTISVQYGEGNYSSNRNVKTDGKDIVESVSAEVAIWDKDGTDYQFSNGGICEGWCFANEVATMISKVSTAKNLKDLHRKMSKK